MVEKKEVRCSIEESLSVIGDRWSLLIVRDVLRGINRFDSLQKGLKISRNILTSRLEGLEQAGILEKKPVKNGAKRMLYSPTPKCMELVPVLIALISWNTKWSGRSDVSWSEIVERETGEPVKVQIVNKNNNPVTITDLDIKF
jgi:DNA-binding HxlR family transcriptional regulator